MSLDGYVAGPNQSLDKPIGEGGMRLHEWAFATGAWRSQHGQEGGERSVDSKVAEEVMQGIGAFIMRRNMFGPGRGAWDDSWTGRWGDDPPYHAPVYVLTHHARRPVEMQGGTTFYFVTDGIESSSPSRSAPASGSASASATRSSSRSRCSPRRRSRT